MSSECSPGALGASPAGSPAPEPHEVRPIWFGFKSMALRALLRPHRTPQVSARPVDMPTGGSGALPDPAGARSQQGAIRGNLIGSTQGCCLLSARRWFAAPRGSSSIGGPSGANFLLGSSTWAHNRFCRASGFKLAACCCRSQPISSATLVSNSIDPGSSWGAFICKARVNLRADPVINVRKLRHTIDNH